MSKGHNRTVTIGNATYEITRVFAGEKTAEELIRERLMEEIGKPKRSCQENEIGEEK